MKCQSCGADVPAGEEIAAMRKELEDVKVLLVGVLETLQHPQTLADAHASFVTTVRDRQRREGAF